MNSQQANSNHTKPQQADSKHESELNDDQPTKTHSVPGHHGGSGFLIEDVEQDKTDKTFVPK